MNKTTAGLIVRFLILLIITEVVIIFFLLQPEKTKYLPPPKGLLPSVRGRIAIVIDDWGYNLNNVPILKQIKYPLTLAILPNLTYSERISVEAHNLKHQTLLHLPLEPQERLGLEKNTILTAMDENTIRNILSKDLMNIRAVKGISNHMGSYATKETKVIAVIFGELKKKGLFFLDSYVSSGSICSVLADKMGVGFIKRDVFLDNKPDQGYIHSQLYKLKTKAGNRGFAVGIGHDRRVTLEVLNETMPELEKEGYKFVHLSELVN